MGAFDHLIKEKGSAAGGNAFSHLIADSASPEKPQNAAPEDESFLKGAGQKALDAVGYVAGKLDSVTGAPTRAAIARAQSGGGLGDVLGAAASQFGEDPSFAPTGKEIAQKAGFSEKTLSEAVPGLYNESGEGWRLKKGGILDPTASGAAGLGVDILADPTALLTGGVAAGLRTGAKVAKVAGATGRIERAGQALGKAASDLSLKAIGGRKADFKKYGTKADEIREFVGKEGILNVGDDVGAVAEKAGASKAKYGERVGAAYQRMDDAGVSFGRKEITDEIRNAARAGIGRGPDQKKALSALDEYIEDFVAQGPTATAAELHEFRKNLDAVAKFERRTPTQSFKDKTFLAARNSVNDVFSKKADTLGGGLGQELKEANRGYHLSDIVEDIAKDRAAAQSANNYLGLVDVAAGAGSLASSGVDSPDDLLRAATLSAASKYTRRYAPTVTAKALSAGSRQAENLSSLLSRAEGARNLSRPAIGGLMGLRSLGTAGGPALATGEEDISPELLAMIKKSKEARR